MPRITFIDARGARREVEARSGASLMEAAVRANVPDILAECGGALSCGTCHIYLDEAGFALAGAPQGGEADLLDFSDHRRETSRLACQIIVTDALDGLVATTPESQYG